DTIEQIARPHTQRDACRILPRLHAPVLEEPERIRVREQLRRDAPAHPGTLRWRCVRLDGRRHESRDPDQVQFPFDDWTRIESSATRVTVNGLASNADVLPHDDVADADRVAASRECPTHEIHLVHLAAIP